MDFDESRTKKNLMIALRGEALAHLKYQFYKSKISNTSKELENKLDEIIHNEKEHGKIWFKLLHGGEIPSDEENLLDGIKGELYEFKEMYPSFSEIAFEEGFDDIGVLFKLVSEIEGNHCKEFESILDSIENGSLFKSDKEIAWKCLNCGHIINTDEIVSECPVCKHPMKYFVKELKCDE